LPKILIVDDAQFMRMRTAKLLAENGYEVAEAENGEVAVSQYDAIHPDIVLMDITMPVMDGLTALRTIKARHPGARIVMCSALGQQAVVMEAIKAGARDFLVKPFDSEKILAALAKHAS
jgi:two-component system chemotaxis response regulator CheY